jgi:hypothetical protein
MANVIAGCAGATAAVSKLERLDKDGHGLHLRQVRAMSLT